MPVSEVLKARLRRQTKTDATTLDDATIDDIYLQVESEYSSYGDDVHFSAAKVEVVKEMLVSAATSVDYQQGVASEKLTDISKNLERLLDVFKADLAEKLKTDETTTTATSGTGVAWGRMRRVPSRRKDYPNA